MKYLKFFLSLALLSLLSLSLAPIPAQAKTVFTKVISLSPSATEDLFAIGAGPQVIAVSSDSNFPASAPSTSLDAFTPNVEAIAALKPDLVVINSGATKSISIRAGLEKLKISVYFESAPKDLAGVYKEILELGKLTGHTQGAYSVISAMRSKISKATASAKRVKGVTFFHELDNTLYSVTSSTFIGSVYKSFGFTNIADVAATTDSFGYPQLSSEYIVKSNPMYIFLSDAQYGENVATVSKRAGWQSIQAVTKKRVVELPDDVPSRWGPRLADFYSFIASIVKK